MSVEMKIEVDGRVLTETKINNLPSGEAITTSKYDDGTELQITQKIDGSVDVKSNKQLVLQADGKTVKIVD